MAKTSLTPTNFLGVNDTIGSQWPFLSFAGTGIRNEVCAMALRDRKT